MKVCGDKDGMKKSLSQHRVTCVFESVMSNVIAIIWNIEQVGIAARSFRAWRARLL